MQSKFNAIKQTVSIHWFRKGLRFQDNLALRHTLLKAKQFPDSQLLPLFIIDPHFQDKKYVGVNRMNFLMECLQDLDDSLQKQLGCGLIVLKGRPEQIFPQLIEIFQVKILTFENDNVEPYGIQRDRQIIQIFEEANKKLQLSNDDVIELNRFNTHTLFDPHIIFSKCNGKIPKTYQAFNELIKQNKLEPDIPIDTLQGLQNTKFKLPDIFHTQQKSNILHELKIYINENSVLEFYSRVPMINEMSSYNGCKPGAILKGGETQSYKVMAKYFSDKNRVAYFQKPNTNPVSLQPDTTALSPYIKFGSLSVHIFYQEILDIYKQYKGKHSQPPESLVGQLMFREFFYFSAFCTKNFDSMQGNSECKQIDWSRNLEYLQAWETGQTGYPSIDATMRQLQQEGWIHHLGRHLVACFLTRGDLWVHWELGAKVFDRLLLDADWALNNANWQWLSASRFFYQYFRVYSPISFYQKYDKEGLYIKKYCPELKNYPPQYIYCPWKASINDQKAFGSIIGKDYPKPIIDHDDARRINMQRMKSAYDDQQGITMQLMSQKSINQKNDNDGEKFQIVNSIKQMSQEKYQQNN